ncbi:uncharacterized protein [Euwallacea similis]|uniref:uncharacterized protein n=1 Tax=Euwallacea similis TaxID=1736056 RepID=UPI00344E7EFF
MEDRVDQLLESTSNYLAIIKCDTSKITVPFKCAIPSCKNSFLNYQSHQKATYKFHNFPKSLKERLKWNAICQLPADTPHSYVRKVCSEHFTLDDYQRDLKGEFLSPGTKRSLKPSALPSININYNLEELDKLTLYPLSSSDEEEEEIAEGTDLASQVENLKYQVISLKNQITATQFTISKKIKSAKSRKGYLAHFKRDLKKTTKAIKERKTAPENFLSKAQIELLKGEKKKVFWSDDDLAKAFSIRHMGGKEFYLYMKNTLNYPLPALACVQAWAAN